VTVKAHGFSREVEEKTFRGFSPLRESMRPRREVATNNGQTYFVTSNTVQRQAFFKHSRWAELFLKTLYSYRPERFLIHGFVVMPDHFHVLMTPQENLERAVQCIKGGFSFRAKKELGWNSDIWIAGFSDHRIRNEEDFDVHQKYIAKNPVEERLAVRASEYAYCSANGRFELDAIPQELKPQIIGDSYGAAKAAPFQSKRMHEATPFQSEVARATGFTEGEK
jgi:putative transposase